MPQVGGGRRGKTAQNLHLTARLAGGAKKVKPMCNSIKAQFASSHRIFVT